MNDYIKLIHEQIELIYTRNLDHVHVDMLHRDIDYLAERVLKMEAALKRIEHMGHGRWHGSGYTLATIAAEGLEHDNEL